MPSDFAQAIAHAEGFGVAGSIPQRAHNPGDLVCPWLTGEKLGAEGIHVFPDDATGWAALEHELDLIRTRRSTVYTPRLTLAQMGGHWSPKTAALWTANVVDWFCEHGRSQTTPQTMLKDLLG